MSGKEETSQMGSRFVRPETARLPLSDGDWILVKRRLTAGEQRHLFARLVKTADVDAAAATNVQLDVSQVGLSTVLAYLLDWSLPEMSIQGQSVDVVTSALDALDTDSYNEILAAITAHEAAMTAEREQEKKLQAGASKSSVTLSSPSDVGGVTSGSLHSTLTCTLS